MVESTDFQIGDFIEWNSAVYGKVRGYITSEPYYNSGLYVYKIDPSNNNETEYPIIYVPHQMYGLTAKIQMTD